MVILEITTNELSGRGDKFSRHYLFDTETMILIADTKTEPYISTYKSEIAKVIGLVNAPHYGQRDESGWYIDTSSAKEVSGEQSKFDELVRKLSLDNNPNYYNRRNDRRAA